MTKENKIALLIGIIALITGGTIGFVLGRRNKDKDKFSNFTGRHDSVFTIDNTTNSPQTVRLFNTFQPNNNPAGVTVSSTVNLPEFNKMLQTDPKLLGNIIIRTYTKPTMMMQMNAPVVVQCKDSNGQQASESLIPTSSQNTFRDDITSVAPPKDLVFDGNCYVDYVVQPKTKVSLNFQWLAWKTRPVNSKNTIKAINGGMDLNTGLTFGNFPFKKSA